ncbi:MAG: Ig-like domain-containing protein, partial [Pirellulales bacterium]
VFLRGGGVELQADGHTVLFTPSANFNNLRGTAGFRYSVTDTGDGTAQAETVADVAVTIDVLPVNDDPLAVDDTLAVNYQDAAPGHDVLANDLDADLVEGDTLTITDFEGVTEKGALVSQATDGTLIYDPNGQFDTLAPGESTTDSFTYTIEDTAGNVASTATVSVTVSRALPPIAQDDAVETDEETPLDINVLADNGNGPDTDPEGDDALLAVVAFDTTSTLGATITQNPDGTLRYDPISVTAFNALARDESAVDAFEYTIRGEKGQMAVATVNVTVNGDNDPPVARDDQAATDETTPIVIDLLADNGAGADFDPDTTNTLSISQFAAQSFLGAAITELPDGTFRYDPTGSSQLNGLSQGANALDTFQYTLVDGFGGLAIATVTVTVAGVNDSPQAGDDTAQTDADQEIDIDVLANDTDADVGDSLTIDSSDTVSPLGATIVEVAGVLRYDPTGAAALIALAEGESVDDTFSYTIIDSEGVTSTATVTVTVAGRNDDPLAAEDGASTDADAAITIDVLAKDSDVDTSDTLVVLDHDATSTAGATVSRNGDG